MSDRGTEVKKWRVRVIHASGRMLGGSCLIPGGNGELTPLIQGDKFQMCLNVVRPKAVSALTSVLTTPITAWERRRCTNEALLSIMQGLRCFRLRSVSHITQFAPQIPTLPSWRLQLCVLCEVWLLSAGSDTAALALQFKDADYHKRKAYFKPYRHFPSSSNLNSSVLLSLWHCWRWHWNMLEHFLCFLNKMWYVCVCVWYIGEQEQVISIALNWLLCQRR